MVMSREVKDSSTRVSHSLPNVRQVKTSVPEGCPSKAGSKSKTGRSNALLPKNYLAWYVALDGKPSEEKLSHIPQMKWKCPPKFKLNVDWRVAAGEGSQEAEVQKNRQKTVKEAIYPHPSLIPPSPFVSPDLGSDYKDDSHTPIIPIEEEEEEASEAAEIPLDSHRPDSSNGPSISGNLILPSCSDDSSLLGVLRGLGSGDLAVAAAAAATAAAAMEHKEQIDTELLIKLLSDPEMIKKLIDENGSQARSKSITVSSPLPSATQVQNEPLCTTRPVEKPIPFLISNSDDPLVRSFTNGPGIPAHSHLHQIPGTTLVRPQTPYAAHSNLQSYQRIVNNPGTPYLAGIKPLASPPNSPSIEVIRKMINEYGSPNDVSTNLVALPNSSTSRRPNMEEIKKMVNDYGAPCSKLLIGSSPLKYDPAVNFPPDFGATGMFQSPPIPSGTVPAPKIKDLNYYKSLIKKHGENPENEQLRPPIHRHPNSYLQGLQLGYNARPIELDSQFQNPYMYSKSPSGWPHSPYQHNVPGQWRPSGVEEDPVQKRMRFHDENGRF